MSVSAALFDDVMSLVLLAALLAAIRTGELPSATHLVLLGGNIGLFFVVTFAIGLFIIPRVGHLIGRAKVAEFELSAMLVCALGYAYLAELLELHFILGAFVAGLFISPLTTKARDLEAVKQKVSGVTYGFFAPVFFASIDM